MEEGSAFKILTEKPAGKRLLGMHSSRGEDNARINLKEMGVSTGMLD